MGSMVIDDVAILKCPICLDVFDKPRLLCCGHTLCASCITQLHLSSRELGRPFACPECRRNVEVPRGGIEHLPPNFLIQRLLDDRRRSNNAPNTRIQVENDIDGLTRLVFRLKQRQKSLEDRRTKILDATRHEDATIRQKGDAVKQRVDEEVSNLLQQLCAVRDDHVTRITARLECVQTQLDSLVQFCSLYGEIRRDSSSPELGDGRTMEERLSRLHALTEELLQHDVTYDDVRLPSFMFSPVSATELRLKNLVGQLDEVDEANSTVEATLAQGRAVWGMTIVDNKLYILRDRYGADSYIDVYDAETFAHMQSARHFPRFRGATDITASRHQMCLYVGDEVEKCVFKIGLVEGCDRWSLENHKPWCVSTTFRDNLLVTLYDIDAIMEFRPDGKCVRQMSLEMSGIVHSQQTLHVSANQLIVCHATRRVSLIDSDGTLIRSHGGVSASTGQPVHGPCYLAVDKNNFIYVADVLYRRVVVYSPSLEFVREVVCDTQLKWWPLRLHVDKDRRRLYVADNNFDGQKYIAGRVVVFSLR